MCASLNAHIDMQTVAADQSSGRVEEIAVADRSFRIKGALHAQGPVKMHVGQHGAVLSVFKAQYKAGRPGPADDAG